jgi:hypothetical protein
MRKRRAWEGAGRGELPLGHLVASRKVLVSSTMCSMNRVKLFFAGEFV